MSVFHVFEKFGKNYIFIHVNFSERYHWKADNILHNVRFLALSRKKEHPPVFLRINFLWQWTKWTLSNLDASMSGPENAKVNLIFPDIFFGVELLVSTLLEN